MCSLSLMKGAVVNSVHLYTSSRSIANVSLTLDLNKNDGITECYLLNNLMLFIKHFFQICFQTQMSN